MSNTDLISEELIDDNLEEIIKQSNVTGTTAFEKSLIKVLCEISYDLKGLTIEMKKKL